MNTLNRVVATGLLTASALTVSGCTSSGEISHSEKFPIETCAPPSTANIQVVENLFDSTPLERTAAYAHDTYDNLMLRLPADTGVTLPDRTYVDKIDSIESAKRPYSEFVGAARLFMEQLGITLTVAMPGELSNGTEQVPTKEQLGTHTAGYEIREVVDGMSQLPTELIGFSGLKHVVLAVNTGDYAYAMTGDEPNTIVVDVANLDFAADLANHEIYHLIDRKECGSNSAMDNDPGFKSLNDGKDIYTKDKAGNSIPEVTNEDQRLDELFSQEVDALNSHNKVEICKVKETIIQRQSDVVANSDYSLANVVEDKAEIGKEMGFPSAYPKMISPNTPIVRNKFIFLMARLYGHLPNVVRYFAATSSRSSDDPLYSKGC